MATLTAFASYAQVRGDFKRISASPEVSAALTYGESVAWLGDPNDDGSTELVVGLPRERRIEIWSVRDLGQVVGFDDVQSTEANTRFGKSLTVIGDLDKDGFKDMAVGGEPLGTPSRTAGSVWVLFGKGESPYLNIVQQIRNGSGGLPFVLPDSSWFGSSVAGLGDLDDDQIPDLAVGAPGRKGNVYLLFLNADGTVKDADEQGVVRGSLADELVEGDRFGESVAHIGDLDADGVADLAVGAPAAGAAGKVFILFLTTGGAVRDWAVIDEDTVVLGERLQPGDGFGTSVAFAGDTDGDGTPDLLVGGIHHDAERGAVWRLFLRSDGSVKGIQQISNSGDGATNLLQEGDQFGASIALVGDIDDDGHGDMAVGSVGNSRGSIWIFFGLPLPLESSANLKTDPIYPSLNEEVNVQAHWGTGVAVATLSFRQSGSLIFRETGMRRTGSVYSGTIPSFSIGERGFQYFMTVTTTAGSLVRIPTEGLFSGSVDLDGVSVELAGSNSRDSYRLLSIPMELDVSDVSTVLERTFGRYDRSRWRLFSQNDESGLLEELDQVGASFAPGRAFWLLSKEGGELLTGPGSIVATGSSFKIPLRSGRWNLFGNPFNFSIPMSAVRQTSGGHTDIEAYSGDWSVPDSLRPFEGYVAYGHHPETDTLILEPSAEKWMEPALSSHSPEWLVTVKAELGLARDEYNAAVVINGATSRLDQFDRPEPPTVGGFLSVHFACEEWGAGTPGCRTDARGPVEEGHVWDLVIESSEPGLLELSFGQIETIPIHYDAVILDKELQIRQDLRKERSYQRPILGGSVASTLRLVVGTPEYVRGMDDVPAVFWTGPGVEVYPNPLVTAAIIKFVLEQDQNVALKIYDLLGRRVTTLLEAATAKSGSTHTVWDGMSADGVRVTPGLYFVVLESSESGRTVRPVVVGPGS